MSTLTTRINGVKVTVRTSESDGEAAYTSDEHYSGGHGTLHNEVVHAAIAIYGDLYSAGDEEGANLVYEMIETGYVA